MTKSLRMVVIVVVLFAALFSVGSGTGWAQDRKNTVNIISPNSPFYFLDRLAEDITLKILPDEKKVDFYLDRSLERFAEAVVMYNLKEIDQAYSLLKEGLENIGYAISYWIKAQQKGFEISNFGTNLKDVLSEGTKTFNQFRSELTISRMVEITKLLADLVLQQAEIYLKLDKK